MKKLILVLAAALALSLLCSCAKPLPEEPVQADPEPEAPAEVHVTTFTADILSSGGGTLTVRPADKDSSFGSADTVTVALADGLVPTGADGWPISVSELTQALQVDITYLGGVETSDPPQVLAVAIRVVPSEEPVEDTTNTVTDPQPVEPVPSEPEAEPFAPVELPAQDPVPAEIPYDGITLYGFQSIRTEIVRSGEADLDGCGTPETVQLLRIWDQYDQQSFVLRIQKGSDVFDTGFEEPDVSYPASFNAHIWLADLDADGYPEVYFNGNMNGDQYVLNVWSMKTGTPELIPFEDQIYLEAAIIGVSDNSLQLESTQNVLGSYSAIRAYALHDDVLTPLGDEWQIVPANTSYSRLSVVRDIPVTLDDGTESVFGPGTVLQVTGTDGKSFVDVITSDGVTGRIAIEQPAGDWQWYIDGESELEYFELVPRVILLDVLDGILPAKPELCCRTPGETQQYEEDRRLFYVAMTRARQQLVLFDCAAERSAFVDEVLSGLPGHRTRHDAEPAGRRTPPPAARAPLPPVDVDSITAVGAHVRHAVFGPGTVESVAGRRVTVRFTAGPRTLDAQVVAERHLMWAE